jgi:hypothetical protein
MAASGMAQYGHGDGYGGYGGHGGYGYEPKVSLEFIELFGLISRIEFF